MSSEQGAHAPGRYLAHTSYSPRATIRHPAMGAWMLHELGQENKNIPGNIVVAGGSNHPGAGYMDLKYGPLPIGDVGTGIPNSELLRGVTEAQFNKRLSLVSKFGKRKRKEKGKNTEPAVRRLSTLTYVAWNCWWLNCSPIPKKQDLGQTRKS